MVYVPSATHWEVRPPAAVGMRADMLQAAIAWHRSHESAWPRNFLTPAGRFIGVADEPLDSEVLGPVRPREAPSGLVMRRGYIAAEWGDTRRADMSFSIAKSYLAVLAGLAVQQRLIGDLDDPVAATANDDAFASPQNAAITWRHLLTQTSEWQGTLWGKPDSIDHNRDVGKSELGHAVKGQPRPLRPPGTLWEYNDVRVNRLSLSLLQRFRRGLGDVLREAVMAPIGAAPDWEWHPYRNSWIDEMLRPGPLNPQYGLLWWLNSGRAQTPSAPESCYAARGAGSNVIWIDIEHDLVVVVRWINKACLDGFMKLVLESVTV